jgi:hypothetical protein
MKYCTGATADRVGDAARPEAVALVLEQKGEVVEAHRRIGALGAESLLIDRQSALKERQRPRKVALSPKQEPRLLRLP